VLVTGFPADLTATNCYVVAPGPGEQCVVIDPGVNAVGRLDELLAEHRLHPVAVLLTHGHLDHTFSVLPVCDARDVPAYIHPLDRGQLTDPWSGIGLPRGAPIFGASGLTFAEPADVLELADGCVLRLAGLELTVRHAPGHTPGSVAFSLPSPQAPLFFSGDLLFAGSIGRVDLPGGSEAQMMRSLAEVVLPLPDETEVLSGHGPETTVGQERATNPYLRLAATAGDASTRG
jgi:glyoxylase-like metal-dependent hydrolase (beta-lactamase superfamily II)